MRETFLRKYIAKVLIRNENCTENLHIKDKTKQVNVFVKCGKGFTALGIFDCKNIY